MMEYSFQVNGYDIKAQYDISDIEHIYKPLLKRWYQIYKDKNRRIIVGIAACPGSGKSTFVSFLEYLFSTMDFNCKLQTVGMDGFHYYNSYLEEYNLKNEKGSQNTFDVLKLKDKIIQTKKENCLWPVYSREIHNPIENQLLVDGDIILIEGNYLLCDKAPWNELLELFDDTLFIYVSIDELKDRLIQRKAKGNLSLEQAKEWYEKSDQKNIEYVLENKVKANIELTLQFNKVMKEAQYDFN